jgi:hypothetical protein
MDIIVSNTLNYNICIDSGNELSSIIIPKNTIQPFNNKISFIIPEIDEEYNIKIIMGNNILTSDNVILDDIKLKLSDKKIFINIKLDMYIFIKIDTKINTIYTNVIKYYNNEIPYYNKLIDIDNYKLKFDLLQTIKIINKKINNNSILLDEESIEYLRSKFQIVINTINTITNQKLLDIKNNLKKQFFID